MASDPRFGGGRIRPTSPVATTGILTDAGTVVDASDVTFDLDDIRILPRTPDTVKNLFERTRSGRPVVRAEDLLALRIELRNLRIKPGTPPSIVKAGSGAARLIVHFPPQAITERTFFEAADPNMGNPADIPPDKPGDPSPGAHPNPNNQDKPEPGGGASETLLPPPVKARIADESRLVFKVPGGTTIPYTLDGILTAIETLELAVVSAAKPRAPRGIFVDIADIFQPVAINALSTRARSELAHHAVSTFRIARDSGDGATIRLRQNSGPRTLRRVPDRAIAGLGLGLRRQPRPSNPSAKMTAIEIPWRLIVSPHAGARWRHSKAPVTSKSTNHTELWHSRMVTPSKDGRAIEPPYPDRNRTIRAVWAKFGSGLEEVSPKMQSAWPDPVADLPVPGTLPFRMPMDDFDRYQIAHLSSNFSPTDYAPQPVDTNLLMLSSLGGWLDARGAWEPPGLSVEEWVHRATMARDHYVKVVYRGFLFPFGHRVSLVKVSERKFHNGKATQETVDGNVAYLRQRFFIIIREPVRTFDDATYLKTQNGDGSVLFHRQFPFSQVEILTERTPDLDPPENNDVDDLTQLMFWPYVNHAPFRFQCAATDLDGRRSLFDLPMIFIDNTRACPRTFNQSTEKLDPDFASAFATARAAVDEYDTKIGHNDAEFGGQRVALAIPAKPGDTSVEATNVIFGGETAPSGESNQSLRTYSDGLNRPLFVPKVVQMDARLGPVTGLTGASSTNRLVWNAHYLRQGIGGSGPSANVGEVFADVVNLPNMARLDFSSQGDKSGGFVQPNLEPKALSRLAGPVMSDVGQFIQGKMPAGAGFPTSPGDLPLPLLFGCIPLGDLIDLVGDIAGEGEKVPKFVSEAGTQLETFVSTLIRAFAVAEKLADNPLSLGDAMLKVLKDRTADLEAQAQAFADDLVADALAKLGQISAALDAIIVRLQALASLNDLDAILGSPDLPALTVDIGSARTLAGELRSIANAAVGGVSLPAGFRQQILTFANAIESLLDGLDDLQALVTTGETLFDALHDIVGNPSVLTNLLSDPGELKARLETLVSAIGPFRGALDGFDVIGEAERATINSALADIEDVLGTVADLLQLVEALAGDELTIRFDWNPSISSFPAPPNEIFRANDKKGLVIAVEGKVKKDGSSSPQISVTCSLRAFDLVLIGAAKFLELNFNKIVFSVDSKAKMDVDVVLDDIKFVGPLSFVEALRDLIPLDGFSDPPYLDISAEGIDAGFDVALPSIAVGVLNISNLSLGAGFTVPFIGQPLSTRFNFCTREQPFCLTVYMFGGGGFFGVTIDPQGVQILEASFEFGASLSIDLGVASGGVEVMAGIYYRMEADAATLTGYFRLGGHVDVLGLITASIELYLELSYEFSTGKCVGRAELTIEISVFIFSGSVTITCERQFAGSNGDPSLRQMMGLDDSVSLQDELNLITGPEVDYAWRDYLEAFA